MTSPARLRCRHKNVEGRAWSPANSRWYCSFRADAQRSIADALVCLDCGYWLPLGPANDSDPRVAVEIEAARIAAHYHDEDYRPGYDRFDWCPETDRDELCAQCETLYLTHVIATHDHREG